MDGSHQGRLRLYAQVNGILDYGQLDFRQTHVRVKEMLLLREVAKKRYIDALQVVHRQRLGEGNTEQAFGLMQEIIDKLLPELKLEKPDTINLNEVDALKKSWEAMFGSLKDPKVQATLDKLQTLSPQAPDDASWLNR